MSAMESNDPLVHDVLAVQAQYEADDPMTEKMIADSISDERALAIRRLADARAQVLDTRDLALALGRPVRLA